MRREGGRQCFIFRWQTGRGDIADIDIQHFACGCVVADVRNRRYAVADVDARLQIGVLLAYLRRREGDAIVSVRVGRSLLDGFIGAHILVDDFDAQAAHRGANAA